ncbi:hypothetical protein BJ742DRAFT_801644 [Cladochytrium replicatum]|nr:hypothetical protein BJ742DRAFT_801644 [Cladochytrium replicatum]
MRSYPSPPQPASAQPVPYRANQRSQQLGHVLDQDGSLAEVSHSPSLNVSTTFPHAATSPTTLNDFHKILPFTSLSPAGLVTPLSTCSAELRPNAAYESSPYANANTSLQQWLDMPSVTAFDNTETQTVNSTVAPLPHFDMVWDNYYDFSGQSRAIAPFQTQAETPHSHSAASLSMQGPMVIPSHPRLLLESSFMPLSHGFLGVDASSSAGVFPPPSPHPMLPMIVTPTVDVHLSNIVSSHSPMFHADVHRGSLSPLPPPYDPTYASRTVSPDVSGANFHLQQQQQMPTISPSPLQSQIYPTSAFSHTTSGDSALKDEPSSPEESGSSADSDYSESDTSPTVTVGDADEASMATTVNGIVVYTCKYCPTIPNTSSKSSSSSSSSIPQRMFRSASNLRNHIKLHHEVGRTFACETASCDKMFFRKQDLERHASTHLPKGVKPFECDACGTRFTRADALSRHFRANRCGKRARNRNSATQRKARRNDSD